eukprot:scaffold9437_cov86-Skeletonema_dohrnii-CCMP3373.AAC.1
MESYGLGSKTILIPGVTFEKSSVARSEMAERDMTERRDDNDMRTVTIFRRCGGTFYRQISSRRFVHGALRDEPA